MLKAVRWLAGLQVAHGLLEAGLASMALLGFLLDPEINSDQKYPEIGYILMAGTILVGLFRVYAGVLCWMVKGRWVGVVSLLLGLASMILCCPTSPILLVFGMIVYFNGDVKTAFARRARGVSAQDALDGQEGVDAIAAVFDADEPAPGLEADRRELDIAIVESVVDLLPEGWHEAFVDLRRSPVDATLKVVVRNSDGTQEVLPDTQLLDVLASLDEFTQINGDYLEKATLHVWEDDRWRFEWQ